MVMLHFSGNFNVFVCVFLQRTPVLLLTGGLSPTRKFWGVVLLLQPASLSTGWVNSRRRNSLVWDKLTFLLFCAQLTATEGRCHDDTKYHVFSPPSTELSGTFFSCHSHFSLVLIFFGLLITSLST